METGELPPAAFTVTDCPPDIAGQPRNECDKHDAGREALLTLTTANHSLTQELKKTQAELRAKSSELESVQQACSQLQADKLIVLADLTSTCAELQATADGRRRLEEETQRLGLQINQLARTVQLRSHKGTIDLLTTELQSVQKNSVAMAADLSKLKGSLASTLRKFNHASQVSHLSIANDDTLDARVSVDSYPCETDRSEPKSSVQYLTNNSSDIKQLRRTINVLRNSLAKYRDIVRLIKAEQHAKIDEAKKLHHKMLSQSKQIQSSTVENVWALLKTVERRREQTELRAAMRVLKVDRKRTAKLMETQKEETLRLQKQLNDLGVANKRLHSQLSGKLQQLSYFQQVDVDRENQVSRLEEELEHGSRHILVLKYRLTEFSRIYTTQQSNFKSSINSEKFVRGRLQKLQQMHYRFEKAMSALENRFKAVVSSNSDLMNSLWALRLQWSAGKLGPRHTGANLAARSNSNQRRASDLPSCMEADVIRVLVNGDPSGKSLPQMLYEFINSNSKEKQPNILAVHKKTGKKHRKLQHDRQHFYTTSVCSRQIDFVIGPIRSHGKRSMLTEYRNRV